MKKTAIAAMMIMTALGGCSTASQHARVESKGRMVIHSTKATRLLSPFGQSAGETISRAKGLRVEADGTVDFKGGTFTIGDILWRKIKKILTWLGILGAAGVVLWFIPATRPFIMLLSRVVASIIPFLGSIVERLRAKKAYEKPLRQTVAGVQEYRKNPNGLTLDQHLDMAQDENAKVAVREIKSTQGIK